MLFDPYADGPFQAASKAAAPSRSPAGASAGNGMAAFDPAAGFGPNPADSADPDRPALPTAEELLQGLNPQQEEAVRHAGSALLIVAGAGSGKTRVLSNRIAYLIATGRAHHGEILAITFTNKAAAEMRERVEGLVGGRAKTMWVSTFHSSCVRILRREATNVGLNSNFSIYDSADSLRLITLVAKNLDLDPKKFAPKAIQHKISALKNELIDADSYASSANYNDPFEQAVAEVFKGYTQRLRQANAMDFDDLIAETVYMFRAFPALADSYRRRFRHVLVDEYQDTNHAQYALVREIVGEGPGAAELTVVGDSDQSIYAFRGADIRNIVEFEKDYPDARTIKLEQNYRSTQTILSAANSVISRNPNRPEKRLWTAEGDGEKIVGYVGENEHDEAQFIAKEIDRLQDEGNLRPGDVAIFYRTNAQSRSIEDVLVRVGLPYKVVGGTRFYERKEIKDALAYLRVLVNPDDDVNLRRILNEPKRGIGDRAEGAVAALAAARPDLLHGRRPARRGGARHGHPLRQRRAGFRETARRPGRGGCRLRRGRSPGSRAGTDRLPRRPAVQHRPPGRIPGGEPRRARRRRARIRTGQPRRLPRRLPGAGVPRGRRRPDPGCPGRTPRYRAPPSPRPSGWASSP